MLLKFQSQFASIIIYTSSKNIVLLNTSCNPNNAYAICKHNWEQLKIHVKSMANNYATTQCQCISVIWIISLCHQCLYKHNIKQKLHCTLVTTVKSVYAVKVTSTVCIFTHFSIRVKHRLQKPATSCNWNLSQWTDSSGWKLTISKIHPWMVVFDEFY